MPLAIHANDQIPARMKPGRKVPKSLNIPKATKKIIGVNRSNSPKYSFSVFR